MTVTIDLTSPANSSSRVDTYLFLLSGGGLDGSVIAEDNNSGRGTDAQIRRPLSGGVYTIFATTTETLTGGPYELRVGAPGSN